MYHSQVPRWVRAAAFSGRRPREDVLGTKPTIPRVGTAAEVVVQPIKADDGGFACKDGAIQPDRGFVVSFVHGLAASAVYGCG